METIRVIRKNAKTKDGREFSSYKLVGDNSRLVDLRFTRDVAPEALKAFEAVNKFEIDAEISDASDRYEYPRVYCHAVDLETFKKIS